ncbi:MAG TPA: hypothetical protein VMT81_03290 [Candidatus Paceibacterota bacterium]|nr:hypothetical protein [Candidatus Paceibacterota bacterium]
MKLDPIGTLFGNAWRRYQERFSTAVLVFLVPIVLLGLVPLLGSWKSPMADLTGAVVEVASVIVVIMASTGLLAAIGKGTGFGESYRIGSQLFGAAVWIAILATFAVWGGLLLLIVPGIILGIRLMFTSYALVFENARGMKALAVSREYSKGFWWALVGRMLLTLLVFVVAVLVFCIPSVMVLGTVGGAVIYYGIILFFTPFSICITYEIYENLRRLKPGAADDAAKSGRGFLKVCAWLGVLAMAGFLALCIWLAMTPPPAAPAGPAAGPSLAPTSGPVGATVVAGGIAGGAGDLETVLFGPDVAARDVPLSADGTITFTVPGSLTANCTPGMACPQFALLVQPGTTYLVTAESESDANATSVLGSFTVLK